MPAGYFTTSDMVIDVNREFIAGLKNVLVTIYSIVAAEAEAAAKDDASKAEAATDGADGLLETWRSANGAIEDEGLRAELQARVLAAAAKYSDGCIDGSHEQAAQTLKATAKN